MVGVQAFAFLLNPRGGSGRRVPHTRAKNRHPARRYHHAANGVVVRRMVQIAVFVEATVKPIAAQVRHREERSDVAIHVGLKLWIAAACGLAMTGLGLCRVSL